MNFKMDNKLLQEMYGDSPKKKKTIEAGTKAQITIGKEKFNIVGPKDMIDVQRILKSHKDSINSLNSEINTLKRDNRTLLNMIKELKAQVQNLNKRDFDNDIEY